MAEGCPGAARSPLRRGSHPTPPHPIPPARPPAPAPHCSRDAARSSASIHHPRSVTLLQTYHPRVEYGSNKRLYCNRSGTMEGHPR